MNATVKLVAVGLAYTLLGEIALLLSVPPGFFVPVWPAAGLAVAATALWGRTMLIPIGIATLIVSADLALRQFGASPRDALFFALCGTAGSLAQAEVGRYVLTRVNRDGNWPLETGREIFFLILVAAPLAALPMAAAFPAATALTGLETAYFHAPLYLRAWLSSLVGIVAFAPIFLLLADRHQVTRRRKIAVVLPMALLLVTILTIFGFSRAEGIRDRRETFAAIAAAEQQAMKDTLDRLHRRLTELGGLFAASESVTPEEFETFVSIAFSRQVRVEDIRWGPRVSVLAEASGLERSAFGERTASPLALYPLDPAAPEAGGIATSLSGIGMPGMIEAVLAGRVPVARLLERRDDGHAGLLSGVHSLVIAAPAYSGGPAPETPEERRRRLSGLALGSIDLTTLITSMTLRHGTDYRLHVEDRSSGVPHTVFGQAPASLRSSVTHLIEMEGLTLALTYTPTSAFQAAHQDWVSWSLLVIGIAFITLLNALTLLTTARTDLVQRLVEEKTAETVALSRNLALILENAADGIISTDADGISTIVNPAAAQLLGYTPQALTGTVLHDVIHPVDADGRPHTRADCPMVTETREAPVRNGVEPFRRKDGTSFPAEYSSEPIFDETGGLVGVVTVFRDITRRQEAQAERERFITELSRANEELERFAFAASHDLQEPLRLISNFNALLARRYDSALDDSGRSYIQHSIKAAERMQALIADLLAYGRLNYDSEPREVDVPLGDIAEDAIRNLQTAIDKTQARIEVSDLPSIRGSRAQLTQLMQNLIGNAIKYHSSGNAVHVSVDAHEEDDAWRISVADNGIGIAPQYREQIFHPFKRLHAKDEYSGTGMGLAICRKIIESHGGVLWVEESPSAGSLFLFTLPKAIEPTHDQR